MTKLQAGHYLDESLTCMRVGLIHQRHTDRCSKDTDDVMMGIRQRRFGGNEWVRDHFATKNEIIDPDRSSEDELVPILLRSHGKMRFPDLGVLYSRIPGHRRQFSTCVSWKASALA